MILDKNPHKAAELVPDRLKFKQLLELCQLICSAGISDVFKPIRQGKELQKWVKNNPYWVKCFFIDLLPFIISEINIKEETLEKIQKIYFDLSKYCCKKQKFRYSDTKIAIFRYVKAYAKFTEYESNSELPIDVAVNEYKKYVEWKEKKYYENRTNRH